MKLILLCIGLSLLIALPAHAQDTTQNQLPDSLSSAIVASRIHPVTYGDSVRLSDSLRRVRIVDSLKKAAKMDSLKIPTSVSTLSAQATSNHQTPSTDSTKIVDIFEEMARAKDQQDQKIKKEAAHQNEVKQALLASKAKAKQELEAAEAQAKAAITKAATAAADSTASQKPDMTAEKPTESKPAQPTNNLSNNIPNNLLNQVDTVANQVKEPRKDTIQLQDGANNSSLFQLSDKTKVETITKDSSKLSGVSKEDSTLQIKQDTIQSIFTLPATPMTTLNQQAVDQDTIKPAASGQAAAKTQQKDNLDQLFEATTDSAREDSSKLKNIQVTAPVVSKDSSLTPKGKVGGDGDTTNNTKASSSILPPTVPHKDSHKESSVAHPKRPSDSTIVDSVAPDSLLAKNTPFTALFQPYRTFDKETNIASTTSLTILQQHVDYKTSADFTTQYQRTGQREGQFLFDVSVVKLNTQVETMGVQLKYDSNQKTDSTSTFAKPLFDIVGKRTYIQVDSTGKITGVDHSDLGRQVNAVLSGLSLSGGDFEIGSNFGLLLSKSGVAAVGQSWTDSISHGGNKRVTTYKVQSIMDGNMLVTISGAVSQTGEISSDGAIFKTHFTGTQKGKMYVDQETLLVKSRDITLNMQGTVDYNGQPLPASAISKIKEKVSAN